ncbi:MAG: CBS domain-containing protein [Bacilli bacterium]|nr:CBS domain-containing protein [Bacilli bacterium]MBN2696487.1 CBS domain-containing protein [Bacilli bacterium]
MDKVEKFLDLFRELETYLRVEYERGDYRESTFMGTLFRIKGRKENPIIANPRYFDTIQQAAQLRNIIVHNQRIAEPSDEFLDLFEVVVKMIVKPEKVYDAMVVMSRIAKVGLDATVREVIELMHEKGFSKIPVFSGDELLGVFTEKALFYHLSLPGNESVSQNTKLKEIIPSIDLDGDPARYFGFIPRDMDVFAALKLFQRDFREKNKLEMLFVTEHGFRAEKILGILTLKDLEGAIQV